MVLEIRLKMRREGNVKKGMKSVKLVNGDDISEVTARLMILALGDFRRQWRIVIPAPESHLSYTRDTVPVRSGSTCI